MADDAHIDIFTTSLLGNLIELLVKRGVLTADDALALVQATGRACAEDNPLHAEAIRVLAWGFEGYAKPGPRRPSLKREPEPGPPVS